MYLTPIDPGAFDTLLEAFERQLDPSPVIQAAWSRIAASRAHIGGNADFWPAQAVALAEAFGMQPLDEAPQRAFSWDGARVRTASEPSVLLHEIAHYQLADPARRALPDFGLGAGPETGCVEIADGARCVEDTDRELEEQLASLLGILWECELGQPAILAFHEQNWLEGAGRASTAEFFAGRVETLLAAGLIDEAARPQHQLRQDAVRTANRSPTHHPTKVPPRAIRT